MPDGKNNIGNYIIHHLLENEGAVFDPRLQKCLNESEENKNSFNKFKRIWRAVNKLHLSQKFQSEKGWEKVHQSVQYNSVKHGRIKNVIYAAAGMAAALILAVAFSFYTAQFSSQENSIVLKTEYGSQSDIVLPDGSKVHLNSGSNLIYNFNKQTKSREVNFTGEAYFEVSKSNRPFTIDAGQGMKVEVLGTKFNLTAYPDDKMFVTTLVEGTVVLSNSTDEKLMMKPGQVVQFEKQSNKLRYINGDICHNKAWMSRKIYLDNTSLAETCKKLERMYNVNISFQSVSLGEKIHHTGVIQEETILDVLEALTDLSDINYKLKGKEITIMAK